MYKQCLGWMFLVVLGLSHSVQAQVYRCENNIGAIRFSDEPCSKGEVSERLNWLKDTGSRKKYSKKPTSSNTTQAKKTAKKAKKNNEAYVLLSLLTTTQLELETSSLRSSLNGKTTEVPELILSDGITVDLLRVQKIIVTHQYGKTKLQMRFIMDDGYEEIKAMHKPFPVISGSARIGRFRKSLQDIKQIEFFNSKMLLKELGNKVPQNKSSSITKPMVKKALPKKDEVSVIELDLTHQLPQKKVIPLKNKQKEVKNSSQTSKKRVPKPQKASQTTDIQVDFVNKKKMILHRNDLASAKGSQKSRGARFIFSNKETIPFTEIQSIRVRPTGKNQLLVAVKLKTQEIKMEVMSTPYTRIIGKTATGSFEHSLSEIKSISF